MIIYIKNSVRMFENKMLRKKYGSKRDETTGEWRRLLAPNNIRVIK
jgi:hypothetical protein